MNFIQHVNLMVDDLQQAVDFYEKILGFPKNPTPSFDFEAQFVAIGEHGEIHLNQIEDAKPTLAHFAVRLDDFSGVFMRALKAGVIETEAFGLPRRLETGVMQAFVRDPSGNLVELSADADQAIDPAIFELELFEQASLAS